MCSINRCDVFVGVNEREMVLTTQIKLKKAELTQISLQATIILR